MYVPEVPVSNVKMNAEAEGLRAAKLPSGTIAIVDAATGSPRFAARNWHEANVLIHGYRIGRQNVAAELRVELERAMAALTK